MTLRSRDFEKSLEHFFEKEHCVKSVRIRSTPYLSVSSPDAGKYGPEKLRIRSFFMRWSIINKCEQWDW